MIWLVILGAAAGAGLRIWVLISPLGALDSDEAVHGLMARHALDGDLSAFFWGQTYGGSQEALLTAPVFALFGSGRLALKLVTLSLYALCAILVWAVGRRMVGETAARLGAVLFWIWPPYLVYWSTKSLPTYGFGLACALVVVLFALRLRERDSLLDVAALGFALGLGWWATPQVALLTLPVLAWLVWRRRSVLRLAWAGGAGFLVGAWPWFAWNAINGWASLDVSAAAGAESTYAGRLWDLFRVVLPTWLGLRVPFSLDWLFGTALGIGLLLLALAGLVLLFARRPRGLGPLLLVAAAFPFLYASSSYTYFVDEPRYLVLVSPVPALLLGWLCARHRAAEVAALGLALALSVAGLVQIERDGLYSPRAPDVRVPADISQLITLLEREDADRVLTDYWLAYRISFESRERVIATSTGFVRSQPHDRLVRGVGRPAWVFLRGSGAEARLRAELRAGDYRRRESGDFVAYVPRS